MTDTSAVMTGGTALTEILSRTGLTPQQLRSVGVRLTPPQASKRPDISRPAPPRPVAAPRVPDLAAPKIDAHAHADPIPAELRAISQWVGWKSVENPGAKKPRKLPIDAKNGKAASSTDPATWSDYATAVAAVARYRVAGVGYVFTAADPFAGVDLDVCRNPDTGAIEPWAQAIIAKLDSYSEVSPSKTGVKIFVRAKLPPNAKHNVPYQTGSVEVYDQGRFFTVTGLHVPGTPATVEARQDELSTVYADVFGKPESAPAPQSTPAGGKKIVSPNRIPHLRSRLGTMLKRGMDPTAIEAALLAENLAKCDPPEDEAKIRKMVADMTRLYPAGTTQPTALESFLSNTRPKLRLRGDNRLLSDVASELGPHLAQVLYTRAGEVVEYLEGALHPISAQQFRTLAEQYVTFYRVRSANAATVQVGATLEEGDSRGILASPQFLACLKPIRHLNTVRLPVIRANGRIELLPAGYDTETATLTDVSVNYAEDTPFADALATIRNLFEEFQFSDGERSRAVALSALLGLYAKQLLKPGELRPAFTYIKNAEGAGATTLAACAIVSVCGDLPIGSKAKDDDEVRKALTSAIRAGQNVVFFDNLKGHLNSPALEAFASAPLWSDRLLGTNDKITVPNNVTIFITSNGLTISPDWRRRSLFAELHLSQERAEDRVFKRPLSAPLLKAMRPKILAACWSLVRHWDAMGQPQPGRSHSAFTAWASIVGGMVESAGFGCPFETANVACVADEDGEAMRQLVAAMTPDLRYSMSDLVEVCRLNGIFEGIVGTSDADWGRAQRTTLGRLLSRYHDRIVADFRFFITGTGHAKRFLVHPLSEGSAPNDER